MRHGEPSSPTTSATPLLLTQAAGYTSFAAAVCSEVPVCAEADGLFANLAPGFDVDHRGYVTVGAADPSYTAPCLQLVGDVLDVIDLGVTAPTIVAMIAECDLQGYDGVYSASYNSVVPGDLVDIDGLTFLAG